MTLYWFRAAFIADAPTRVSLTDRAAATLPVGPFSSSIRISLQRASHRRSSLVATRYGTMRCDSKCTGRIAPAYAKDLTSGQLHPPPHRTLKSAMHNTTLTANDIVCYQKTAANMMARHLARQRQKTASTMSAISVSVGRQCSFVRLPRAKVSKVTRNDNRYHVLDSDRILGL